MFFIKFMKNHFKSASAEVLILLLIPLIFISCASSLESNFPREVIDDFYQKAENAAVKYIAEPAPGIPNPFPASFVVTGSILLIEKPASEGSPPRLPSDVYSRYSMSEYSWFTKNPDEVRYIVLIEPFIIDEGPDKTPNSIMYTIIDLSYDEQIYKAIITGDPDTNEPPYKELGDILDSIVL